MIIVQFAEIQIMHVLFIYRNSQMGFSIGKVFRPIEEEMQKYADVDALYLPVPNYSPNGLWRNIKAVLKVVKERHYDIVHITGAEHYLIPFLFGQKVVVTVHDMGSLTIKKGLLHRWLKQLLFVKSLRLAVMVTFISEKSEEEGIAALNNKSFRHTVVYDPISPQFTYSPKKINIEKPTILHIGTKRNKNLIRVAEALQGMNIHLRIIGVITDEQKVALENSKIEYSNAYNLSDNEIVNEYRGCDIISFPSLYEGFGMPIIEGQAVGRVVVTSNLEPMKSVAGNAAIFVDPYDSTSIRQGFERAIVEHEKYVSLGLENVKRFSLDKIALEYYHLYKSVE